MGAFTDWLIATYGIERYMQMYKRNDIPAAMVALFKKTPEELNREFVSYVQLFRNDEVLEERMEGLLKLPGCFE